MSESLFCIENLRVAYPHHSDEQPRFAVDDVSLTLQPGERMGLVGESGCGKSTLGRAAMRLLPPSTRIEGKVKFQGRSVLDLTQTELRQFRGEAVALVFQDPMTRLDPLMTIGNHCIETLKAHSPRLSIRSAKETAIATLEKVKIPASRWNQYPHEFSGGMRQRVAIALALLLNPKLIVADEPTTSLDVTVSAQILQELTRLCTAENMALLMISHDLAAVAEYCELIGVMYNGKIVEMGSTHTVFQQPQHEYTRSLLKAALHIQAGATDVATDVTDNLTVVRRDQASATSATASVAIQAGATDVATDVTDNLTVVRRDQASATSATASVAIQAGATDVATDVTDNLTVVRRDQASATSATASVAIQAGATDVATDVTDNLTVVRRDQASASSVRSSVATPILRITDLKQYYTLEPNFVERLFQRQSQTIKAVDEVNLELYPGEILGLVGESGCGKSTLSRTVLQLIPPTSGKVEFLGKDLTTLSRQEMRSQRRQMQMMFQDPHACLNPAMTVGQSIADPLLIHKLADPHKANVEVLWMLEKVGLTPPEVYIDRYPSDLSGGQQQRVAIARALITRPKLIICDEPVSMLDASVQSQVLDLMLRLKAEFDLTYLFITHDLWLARFLCDRIAVMNSGKIVEIGPTKQIFANPQHPYTKTLLAAAPLLTPA